MPEMRMNSLKSLAMNCGPLSEMIRGLTPGCCSLARSRTVSLGHPLAKIPMNQETAVAIQDAAQVVERRANVQVGNIDMPMLVRLRRLFKTRPFLRGTPVPLPQQSGPTQ